MNLVQTFGHDAVNIDKTPNDQFLKFLELASVKHRSFESRKTTIIYVVEYLGSLTQLLLQVTIKKGKTRPGGAERLLDALIPRVL